jgi:hypothetical protein
MVDRRTTLGLLATGLLGTILPAAPASAGAAVSISLNELVRRSRRIILGTSVGGESRWEVVAEQRRIVTYHQLRTDELVAGDAAENQLVVRTLGGRVGEVGQIVHGEAMIVRGQPALLFLSDTSRPFHYVTARAQGHYPVFTDARGTRRLRGSPYRAVLTEASDSAGRRLINRNVAEGIQLVRDARSRGR